MKKIAARLCLLALLPLALSGCSTARMAVDPDLLSRSDQYEISERPSAFSGDKLLFGPYSATEIDRSTINSSGSGFRAGGVVLYSSKEVTQSFSYRFNGNQSWTSKCAVKSASSTVKQGGSAPSAATVAEDIGLQCRFSRSENPQGSANRNWKFEFRGQDLVSATGSFKVGSKTVRVVATNRFENSSFPYHKPTGYYFYVGEERVAGVDVINNQGPIWLKKNLAAEEKDSIGLIMVALLLNQV